MPVSEQQKDARRSIVLEGNVNIACAAELRTILVEALDARQALEIRLEETLGVDVCIVQLLNAAIREWKQSGIDFEIIGPMREELSISLLDAGFDLFPVAASVELPIERAAVVSSEV